MFFKSLVLAFVFSVGISTIGFAHGDKKEGYDSASDTQAYDAYEARKNMIRPDKQTDAGEKGNLLDFVGGGGAFSVNLVEDTIHGASELVTAPLSQE